MRGTPGSAFPEYEPNATELPSCAPISAPCATSFTCSVGGGARVLGLGFPAAGRRLGTMRTVTRPSRHRRRPPPSPAPSPSPRPSRARPSRVAQGSGQNARKMSRKPSLGLPHQQRVQRPHCTTMKKPFAWGLAGCARDRPCASWVSRSPTSRLNDRRLGLALVVQRSGKVRGKREPGGRRGDLSTHAANIE